MAPGKHCEEAGVSKKTWEECQAGTSGCIIPLSRLTIGIVLELYVLGQEKSLLKGLGCLCSHDTSTVDLSNFCRKVKKLCEQRRTLLKSRKRDDGKQLMAFETSLFSFTGETTGGTGSDDFVRELQTTIRQQSREISRLTDALRQAEADRDTYLASFKDVSSRNSTLEREIARLNESYTASELEMQRLQERFAQWKPHNVNRREKRHVLRTCQLQEQVTTLTGQCQEQAKLVSSLNERKRCLEDQVEEERRKKRNLQKRVCRLSGTSSGDSSHLQHRVTELKKEIQFLENAKCETEDKLAELLDDTRHVFRHNRYDDNVRSCYMELRAMGVSARNCQGIVQCVLNTFTDVQVDRLPGEAFARRMSLECRGLALMHLREVMEQTDNLTLHCDGTTKYFHHYGAYDISLPDGRTLTMGMRDMCGGDSEAYLQTLKTIVHDVATIGDSTAQDRPDVHKMAMHIKNTMSDRHIVNKKFNSLLKDYREEVFQELASVYSHLTTQEKKAVLNMNNFFCGLHFLVGLATAAESALKVWDSLIFGGQKIGAAALPGSYTKAESGTIRLIRTVCKAVHERGCQKSGIAGQFKCFMETELGLRRLPLEQFIGNRFNIIFRNGAGIYFLCDTLRAFFDEHKHDNKLLRAVHADLQIEQFIAGARALGVVSKVITEPLWKAIEEPGHISGMNVRYQRLVSCLEKWMEDPTPLLTMSDHLFDDIAVKQDYVTDSLKKDHPQTNIMTKQVLELMLSSFLAVCKNQLAAHLADGEHAVFSKELYEETISVKKDNIAPERDFASLDHSILVRPSLHTVNFEGMLMFRNNKVSMWLNSKSETERQVLMSAVRKSVQTQRHDNLARAAEHAKFISHKRKVHLQEKEDHERRARVIKEDLSVKLTDVGGLWTTVIALEEHLAQLDSDIQQRRALEVQMKYRRQVLQSPNPDGVLNLSAGGCRLPVSKLRTNLQRVIETAQTEHQCVQDETVDGVDGLVSALADDAALQVEKTRLLCGKKNRKQLKSGRKSPIPQIQFASDLIGKRVRHLCEEDGKEEWFAGWVVSMETSTSGRSRRYVHQIQYDCEPGRMYSFPLMSDLRKGELEVLQLESRHLVGKTVDHRFEDEEGNTYWCSGKVMKVDNQDTDNPQLQVQYEDQDLEWYALYEDYAAGDLRVIIT